MYEEFVGLTRDVLCEIEGRRQSPNETKNDILRRVLNVPRSVEVSHATGGLDVGQGVYLADGERLYLYLSTPNSDEQKPDATAEIKSGHLFIYGKKVNPSRGSVIAPAMQEAQKRLGHLNGQGKPISLSAFRQWRVIRNGRLVPLDDLKDPKLRRKRARKTDGVDLRALHFEL